MKRTTKGVPAKSAGSGAAGDYAGWLRSLKSQIRRSQIKAAIRANEELLRLYWDMGRDIAEKRLDAGYGSGFFDRLSRDLKAEFPGMEGFSPRNLRYIRDFYRFYAHTFLHQPGAESGDGDTLHQLGAKLSDGGRPDRAAAKAVSRIRQQSADEMQVRGIHHQAGFEFNCLFSIPWRHHVEIFTHAGSAEEALFYVAKTAENGWSRNILMNMMEADLYHAEGRAVTNFAVQLPAPESDLAQHALKDPYVFDFLNLRERHTERELESALVENIARFLLELGQGFSFVGRQYQLEVDGEEFFVDLLFYHLVLRRYIVVELKTGDFKPEFVEQLGFYVQAVNARLKHPTDEDAIGLLICKRKKKLVAEYALKSSSEPIGVAEYKLTKLLPRALKAGLPSVGEIESGLTRKSPS